MLVRVRQTLKGKSLGWWWPQTPWMLGTCLAEVGTYWMRREVLSPAATLLTGLDHLQAVAGRGAADSAWGTMDWPSPILPAALQPCSQCPVGPKNHKGQEQRTSKRKHRPIPSKWSSKKVYNQTKYLGKEESKAIRCLWGIKTPTSEYWPTVWKAHETLGENCPYSRNILRYPV